MKEGFFRFYFLTSTIDAKHPSYGPLPPDIMRLENIRSNTREVCKSLPRIMSYLTLAESSILHFHVVIFVALNSGSQNSTITFFNVVNLQS